jgi:LPXTG-motif cell wall-anchored protein
MRKLKKALAVLLSAAMVLGMSSMAFAEPETKNPGDRTADSTINVQELAAGDAVTYYQVIEWVDSEGWAFKAPFDTLDDADLKKITGTPAVAGMIDQELATKIAGKVGTTKGASGGTVSGTEWSKSDVAPGLYMVVIAAKESGVVYNPVFVAADFDANNGTNSLGISTASYSDAGIAKKKVIRVDKNEKDSDSTLAAAIDSYVGQKVGFEIKTTIPVYLPTFKNPSFAITDNISTQGIKLAEDENIVVKLNGEENTTNFDITDKSDYGFKIKFKTDYLKGNKTPVDVTVEYKGIVTNQADFNVNQEKNEVVVKYANGPEEEKGALKDISNTYIFSIGAALLGDKLKKTSELVKVGVDQNGQYIVEEELDDNSDKKVGALPGATFMLSTDSNCSKPYVNDLYPEADGGAVYTTKADGVITFKGLAAGTYYLKETHAPNGYIKDPDIHTIVITPRYAETQDITETVEGITVTYKTNVLKSYTVTIDGKKPTEFTMTNEGPTTSKSTINEDSFEVKNTAGVELPATGGIGTTIFYILGSILVIGAGVILVARRRMGSIQE